MRVLEQGSDDHIYLRDRVLAYMGDELPESDSDFCYKRIGPCFAMVNERSLYPAGGFGRVKLWPEEVLTKSASEWKPCFDMEWREGDVEILHAYRPGDWEKELLVLIDLTLRSRKIARQAHMEKSGW